MEAPSFSRGLLTIANLADLVLPHLAIFGGFLVGGVSVRIWYLLIEKAKNLPGVGLEGSLLVL